MDVVEVREAATSNKKIVSKQWMSTGNIRPLIFDNPREVWLGLFGESFASTLILPRLTRSSSLFP